MEMTAPVGRNAIDINAGGLIGKKLPRVEGPLKVSGRAPYAYEVHPDGVEGVLYGYPVPAPIGLGSIGSIDTDAATASPGVIAVLTHDNMPQGYASGPALAAALKENRLVNPILASHVIDHYGQPVACVVAETFEQAVAAAALVKVECSADASPHFDLRTEQYDAPKPAGGPPPDSRKGDFDRAFGSCALRIDESYSTPAQSQAMMEPPATLAIWHDANSRDAKAPRLTLHTSHQIVDWAQEAVAALFGLDREAVEILSPYVGGGFGAKLQVLPDAILAAACAKVTGRPVKIALPRPQIFNATSHRSATIQWVQLGADRHGVLKAVAHRCWSGNLPDRTFYEQAAAQTRHLYATPNLLIEQRNAALNLTLAASMRAPGEAVGLLALESAMDQLAELGQIDPIELRLRNEPKTDPETGKPFSERRLVECLKLGADKFGWSKRTAPGQRSEGAWMIGMGMACAIRTNLNRPSGAKVTLSGDGRLLVQTSMTDIGTGTYTILTQIAAEMLGLDPSMVTVALGDTDFPASSGSGGSWGAGSSGSAVYDACMNLRARLAHEARIPADRAVFARGRIGDGRRRSQPLRALVRRGALVATGSISFGSFSEQYYEAAYGAHFAEVGIDRDSGEIRLRRMLGVFDIGRVLNHATARSQLIGGMTLGVGAALSENLVADTRSGAFINHDFAEYLIPVQADIGEIDAIMLDAVDDKTNPLKSKGAGEIGVCGAGAAVANAIHNACGARVRDYPITLDKIMDHLG
ncbi:xanthine dehydrogenase family protein molybdopterin-binding subunit [Endobacter medicaginis]|uniref:Xanthine dehydrogenase family protein molybdopterin-binding subunit n=2 Tax=Endobacter medicaginis TaxID=1181271 RepID=A0A850NMK8_9PROT|nr:xanthine dehydrogenase family protein molybdopterin-binding subunit [Endobacter medicaginis]NVN30813.1 xanthine dehydrogenase family protein molybdopterin-binding subunit [Endobacter medicaginis]